MKVVYCRACDAVWVKSKFEPERCGSCGGPTSVATPSRPWQSWMAGVVLVIGTVVLVATDLPEITTRILILLAFVALALYFSTWGARRLKADALARGRATARGGERG